MLTTLILNKNPEVNDNFCVLLKVLVEGRSPLTKLELDETSITSQGLLTLISACDKSTIIDTISVRSCPKLDLSEFMFADVVEALTHNCSITNLDLKDIDVDPEGQ